MSKSEALITIMALCDNWIVRIRLCRALAIQKKGTSFWQLG
jgi:hypothetical protein